MQTAKYAGNRRNVVVRLTGKNHMLARGLFDETTN